MRGAKETIGRSDGMVQVTFSEGVVANICAVEFQLVKGGKSDSAMLWKSLRLCVIIWNVAASNF
jgi:hypothetical protein